MSCAANDSGKRETVRLFVSNFERVNVRQISEEERNPKQGRL